MFDMIKARRESEKKEERYDLFSQLLDANQEETEEGGAQMSDRELVGASTSAVSFLYANSIFRKHLRLPSGCEFNLCVHASFLRN